MSMIARLNADIIHIILDMIYWKADGSIDRHTLAMCSRISRAWLIPAQNRLFSTIQIRSRASLRLFMKGAPSTSRGRYLRSLVRQLDTLLLKDTRILGLSTTQLLSEGDFTSLFGSLPNLYALLLHTTLSVLSSSTVQALASSHGPQFCSLIVDYIADLNDRYHEVFFQLLDHLPLKRAAFFAKGTYMWERYRRTRSSTPPRVRLQELRIDLQHSQPTCSGEDLAWLCGNSPGSLEILHLNDLVLDSTMSGFIFSIAHQLRALRISSSRHSDLQELPNWLKQMKRLEELVIRNDLPTADRFNVRADLPPLLNALPNTIHHLGFMVTSSNSLLHTRSLLLSWSRVGENSTVMVRKIPVLTLILSDTEIETSFIDSWPVGRLRFYQSNDEDIYFAFVSTLDSHPSLIHLRIRQVQWFLQ